VRPELIVNGYFPVPLNLMFDTQEEARVTWLHAGYSTTYIFGGIIKILTLWDKDKKKRKCQIHFSKRKERSSPRTPTEESVY